MDLARAAQRYMEAVEALHTIHSSMDVHGHGGFAAQAITPHCGLICNATGGYMDPLTGKLVKGDPPHREALEEYGTAKAELQALLAERE